MFFLDTVKVNIRKEFCSLRPVLRMESSHFCINNFMNHPWLDKIFTELKYNDWLPPLFVDKF